MVRSALFSTHRLSRRRKMVLLIVTCCQHAILSGFGYEDFIFLTDRRVSLVNPYESADSHTSIHPHLIAYWPKSPSKDYPVDKLAK